MFVPLHDQNPLLYVRLQYVTISLIIANCAIFIMTILTMQPAIANDMAFSYGVIPSVLFDLRDLPPGLAVLPDELTLVSFIFYMAAGCT
ncbi:MAG: hypothetical protein K8F25_17215 [Fimbriimonadaceae bacterium]|nr:hypothetical protein [Alphaproteobacteria bacterium]